DGIRDFHVTEVQTCALPIWSGEEQAQDADEEGEPHTQEYRGNPRDDSLGSQGDAACRHVVDGEAEYQQSQNDPFGQGARPRKERSEERRVGKECVDRWLRYA